MHTPDCCCHKVYYPLSRKGATGVEYGVLLGLIALVVIALMAVFGAHVACMFQRTVLAWTVTPGTTIPTCKAIPTGPQWVRAGSVQAPILLHTGTDGLAYNDTIPLALDSDGSTPSYQIAQGSLPNGLNFDPTSGAITGTPAATPMNPGATTTVALLATDSKGRTSILSYVEIPVIGHLVFAYTGSDQSMMVAAPNITFKLWGAGGASLLLGPNETSTYQQRAGGAGGFTTGTLSTAVGSTVTIVVGQGGQTGPGTGAYGGGGSKDIGFANINAGRGGGRSSVLINGGDAIVAGAGGGAGVAEDAGSGGGLIGGTSGAGDAGTGGTQSAGGAPPSETSSAETGSLDQGGSAIRYDNAGNGSGGGGYYGGGAGSDYGDGSGGGGSSYLGNAQNASTQPGQGIQSPNTSDPDYQAGVAKGGSSGSDGGPGLVVASWPP